MQELEKRSLQRLIAFSVTIIVSAIIFFLLIYVLYHQNEKTAQKKSELRSNRNEMEKQVK